MLLVAHQYLRSANTWLSPPPHARKQLAHKHATIWECTPISNCSSHMQEIPAHGQKSKEATMLITCGVFAPLLWPKEIQISSVHKCLSHQISTWVHEGEWCNIIWTEADQITISCLRHGFPTQYEGPVLTPTSCNHASANNHPRDVTSYISKELSEGAMLDTFDYPPPFLPLVPDQPSSYLA